MSQDTQWCRTLQRKSSRRREPKVSISERAGVARLGVCAPFCTKQGHVHSLLGTASEPVPADGSPGWAATMKMQQTVVQEVHYKPVTQGMCTMNPIQTVTECKSFPVPEEHRASGQSKALMQ